MSLFFSGEKIDNWPESDLGGHEMVGKPRRENSFSVPVKERGYESFFRRSWWVLLFIALCYVIYSQGMEKKRSLYRKLLSKQSELAKQKSIALDKKEELLMQIDSEEDPQWIQLVLMKSLGVVPDGQIKVYFEKENHTNYQK